MLRAIALAALTGAGYLVVTDVLHSPTRQYPITAPAGAAPTEAPASRPGRDRSIAGVEASADQRGDQHEVTVFSRAPIEIGGRRLMLVVGEVYSTSSSAKPMHAYCYLEGGGSSPESLLTVHLATKDGDGLISSAQLQDADAAAIEVPLVALRAAVEACRFL